MTDRGHTTTEFIEFRKAHTVVILTFGALLNLCADSHSSDLPRAEATDRGCNPALLVKAIRAFLLSFFIGISQKAWLVDLQR